MERYNPNEQIKMYLVEDDPLIRDSLVRFVETKADVEVVGSAAGESEARIWLASNPTSWDVAVVDMFLSQGSGLSVVAACRKRPRGKKLVVLTSCATHHIRQRCIDAGADAVFDKSNQLDEFIRFVTVH